MGSNVYLEDVASYGYDTEAAATAIRLNIPGKAGKRIAIRAWGAQCGATATYMYFMRVLGRTTVNGAQASGITTQIVLTDATYGGATLATNDWLAFKMDDGTVHFSYVTGGTYRSLTINDALDDTMADGNEVWAFMAYGDEGHLKYKLTTSAQTTGELDGGMFYADAKGDPMIVYHANDAAVAGSIDYVTVDFINK